MCKSYNQTSHGSTQLDRISSESSREALRAQLRQLHDELIAAQEAHDFGEALACRNAIRDLESRGVSL